MESNFLKIAAEIVGVWWGEVSWGGYNSQDYRQYTTITK